MSSTIYLGKRISLANLRPTPLERRSVPTTQAVNIYGANTLVKCGYLWKRNVSGRTTTRSSVASHTRFFVLSKANLDYYRNERCEKLKGSYPLTDLKVNRLPENPTVFVLHILHEGTLWLDARCKDQCRRWITAIEEGISSWALASDNNDSAFESRQTDDGGTLFPSQVIPSKVCSSDAPSYVLGEFPMIKYSSNGKEIPREKVFMLDNSFLQLMWKKVGRLKVYNINNTLSIDRIVEVRCGQQTKNFVNFPYLEVERQSFSLMFEREKGEFSQLCSIDLISDSVLAFQHWKAALKELVYGGPDGTLPLRRLQRLVDPLIIFLKKNWTIMQLSRSSENKKISFDEVLSFIKQFIYGFSRRDLKNHIKAMCQSYQNSLKATEDHFNWDAFMLLIYTINKQPKLLGIYHHFCKKHPTLGMTVDEFFKFLKEQQKVSDVSLATCVRLIKYHDRFHRGYKRICASGNPSLYQTSKSLLSFHGFQSFIRSEDNSVFNHEHETVHQSMDHPLSDYFISSSHNTYLTGRQIKGMSSCEAYVRALQRGCRSLEIDCWDGADEPVVTHGFSLTTKIRLRDVLNVIKAYAFDMSPYPVILSLENHCNEEQQTVMASMFYEIFGDMLATDNLSRDNMLPSPDQLKHKIILKGRVNVKKKSRIKVSNTRLHSSSSAKTLLNIQQDVSSLQRLQNNASEGEEQMVQVPLDASMGKLIVYCRSVAYKRDDILSSCCEMHSLAETFAADEIDKFSQGIVHLSSVKLLRSYPKGSRYDSSNYSPMSMWKGGIQMASINFQKPDIGMHINDAFFLTNGNCGYVLKPSAMRGEETISLTEMMRSPTDWSSMLLDIEVLSAQFVNVEIAKASQLSLEIEIAGTDSDCASSSTEASVNPFNPAWSQSRHSFRLMLSELAVVYFKVTLNNTKLVLQNAFPVSSVKEGLRYIPMKSITGVDLPASGLYVMITKQIEHHIPPSGAAASTIVSV